MRVDVLLHRFFLPEHAGIRIHVMQLQTALMQIRS